MPDSKHSDLLVNIKIYYISFALHFFGSLYQLIWPGALLEHDSSGFGTIHQTYIWPQLFYIFMATVIGLLFFRAGKEKYFQYLCSPILVLSPIWFWQLFLSRDVVGSFLNQDLKQAFSIGWQISVFSCLIFSIFQFVLVVFYHLSNIKNQDNKLI